MKVEFIYRDSEAADFTAALRALMEIFPDYIRTEDRKSNNESHVLMCFVQTRGYANERRQNDNNA